MEVIELSVNCNREGITSTSFPPNIFTKLNDLYWVDNSYTTQVYRSKFVWPLPDSKSLLYPHESITYTDVLSVQGPLGLRDTKHTEPLLEMTDLKDPTILRHSYLWPPFFPFPRLKLIIRSVNNLRNPQRTKYGDKTDTGRCRGFTRNMSLALTQSTTYRTERKGEVGVG